jgi:nucleoside-diphosphate-sugar epimerase
MPPQVLLTGGSGYIATLIAAALIERTDCRIVAAVRTPKSLFDLEDRVARELPPERRRELSNRFRAVCVRPADEGRLVACLREHHVTHVVHCAGSVDYANARELFAANVELTRICLAAAQVHGVCRFIHISTAFSAGSMGPEAVREALHPDPPRESTVYTQTKRQSERLVAESGLPFVIVRPSILIGHSADGRYAGKAYGVYQFWRSVERLLCDRWRPHLHVVAPQEPLALIHQDHFMSLFAAAFNHAAPNSIVHAVSADDSLPTCRDVWNIFAERCLMPDSVTFYDRLEQVPLPKVDRRNQAFIKAVATNVAISSQHWRFDTTNLRRLRQHGCDIPRASLASLLTCQQAYVARSTVLERFQRTHLTSRRTRAVRPAPLNQR